MLQLAFNKKKAAPKASQLDPNSLQASLQESNVLLTNEDYYKQQAHCTDLDQLVIFGENKFKKELFEAMSFPENKRRIINKDLLMTNEEDENDEEENVMVKSVTTHLKKMVSRKNAERKVDEIIMK